MDLLSFKLENKDCDFNRIERLQARTAARIPALCHKRAEIITDSFSKTEGEPIVVRRTKAFAKILSNMTVYIEPVSLIVGNQASLNFAVSVFPEYSFEWEIKELDSFEKRSGDFFIVSENTKTRLKKLRHY